MTERASINWTNLTFLAGTHAVAVLGTAAYLTLRGPSWAAVGIAAAWFLACGLSMTAGYHRLFSHGSYEAHPAVRAFFLFFGAAQFENSALKWSVDHRRHHSKTDQDEDPYNAKKGFWWSHFVWILFHDGRQWPVDAHRDLTADRLVMLQHRFYVPLAAFGCFVLPTALGALLGDAWGALILAGFFRLVVLHHSTFCVNSVAHAIGRQPYSDRDTARDSFVTALLTLGEGYHNYHHRFPADYRNGVRYWQFDPTKWAIRLMSFVGLTRDLKRVSDARILKARLAMQAKRAERSLGDAHAEVAEALASMHQALEGLLDRWEALKLQVAELRRRRGREARQRRAELRREFDQVRAQFRETCRDWQRFLREQAPQAVAG
jgi:stearoyl-CoA desaturase (delta-9 desaturase)